MKKHLLLLVIVTLTLLSNAQTVTDIDGNIYHTVSIGTQIWMAENLRTTKYADGSPILLKADSIEWIDWNDTITPAYCWYNNDSGTYSDPYGALYNWSVVNTGILCPTGWHVPTQAEWSELIEYLGGDSIAGGKLKESGTTHWNHPNTDATNESGFTALPGGYRHPYGSFNDIFISGNYWTATEYDTLRALMEIMQCNNSNIIEFPNGKMIGFSVRCIKDNDASLNKIVNTGQLVLYPNPATERLNINITYPINMIQIYDLHGKRILYNQYDLNSIDISNLKNGIYMIKIISNTTILNTKFIKQ